LPSTRKTPRLPLVVLTCAAVADPVGVTVDLAVGEVLPHPARNKAAVASAPTHPAAERVPPRLPDIPWFLPVADSLWA
jgi:hypothetical protein